MKICTAKWMLEFPETFFSMDLVWMKLFSCKSRRRMGKMRIQVPIFSTLSPITPTLPYKPEGRGFDSPSDHWDFYWPAPSGRTITLGSTQPLTEISTTDIPWGKGDRCVGLTILPPSCADCQNFWQPQPPGALGEYLSLYRDSFTFHPNLIQRFRMCRASIYTCACEHSVFVHRSELIWWRSQLLRQNVTWRWRPTLRINELR